MLESMSSPDIVKPTPPDLLEDTGSGLDYGTNPARMLSDITPIDRFFIRSHVPTRRSMTGRGRCGSKATVSVRPSPTAMTTCSPGCRWCR